MPTKRYQFLEHTADVCVKVYGKDLKTLFKNSAISLFEIISQKRRGKQSEPQILAIKKSADNIEELLINWLGELISLSETKDLIFNKFKITKLTGKKIEAIVSGVKRENYRIKTEVKAATYHELSIEKAKTGWQAQIIFDV
ncbi:MAG: archease [Candidatus Omnitrophota bacterium]|nr:archease [Candidatus Omnitrophota bacterium]